jgi:ubiquinone/menaquinone biosynthesis C-methylase UbiE
MERGARRKYNVNPFNDPALVEGYETWYETAGRRADRLEKALLCWLLTRFSSPRTILEVGCGTGHFTRWFKEQGFQASGLDISALMLEKARHLDSLPYMRGDALALPFSWGSFDVVALITTLEFVPDPVQALTEAMRVAQYGLILGVLNHQSILGRQLGREGGPIWRAARFFKLAELVQEVRRVAGEAVTITWRTTLWPVWPGMLPLPWGGVIGMAVLRTRL